MVNHHSVLAPNYRSKLLPQSIWNDPELSPKIREACAVARKNGYRYIWIDSCCIDKSSSSELSEAINSMYKWYDLADVCYAYLADVPRPPKEDDRAMGYAFRKSRWFGRGWTLQELIAPFWVEFLSQDWVPIGSKHALVNLVQSVTNIDEKALLRLEPLDAFSVAQRLSWAAGRETTRVEDRAYSLLGIFNINMPTLYGEGDHAFRRLQEQIMHRIPDQSLFAWGGHSQGSHLSQNISTSLHCEAVQYTDRWQNLFAPSPDAFKNCESIGPLHHGIMQLLSSQPREIEYMSTPYGIRTQFAMIPITQGLLLHAISHGEDDQLKVLDLMPPPEDSLWYLAILQCGHPQHSGDCLLGRVCWIAPSSDSGIEVINAGFIEATSKQGNSLAHVLDLFSLSPETIEHYCQDIELKTVYIPHPYRGNLRLQVPSSLQRQPYTVIRLVLSKETRDALRSRGFSADLRYPHPAHPTTHWLTLTKDEHIITVKFQHTLKDDGRSFTVYAEIRTRPVSGSLVHSGSTTPDSDDQVDCHTVSWSDNSAKFPWMRTLGRQTVELSVAGGVTFTVNLRLDFAGTGVYILRVDALSDASPESSAVNLPAVVQQPEEVERTKGVTQLERLIPSMLARRIRRRQMDVIP